jgi:hypothetical protein
MLRTERLNTCRNGTKVRNYGFYALAQVIDVRLVRTEVNLSTLDVIDTCGEVGRPGPEKFVTIHLHASTTAPSSSILYVPLCHLVDQTRTVTYAQRRQNVRGINIIQGQAMLDM